MGWSWWKSLWQLPAGFRRFWAAAFVSTLGDHVLSTALALLVLARSGSLLGVGSLLIAQALPRVMLGSWAGVLADRWSPRQVLVSCDVARAALVLVLLAVPVAHEIALADAVLMGEGFLSVLFFTARARVLPALVPESQLHAANGYLGAGLGAARVLGPGLAGLLLVRVGLPSTIVADAASYLLSAGLVGVLALGGAAAAGGRARDTLWSAWRAGIEPLWREPWLRWMLGMLVLVLLADGALSPGWFGFIEGVLHQNAEAYGWVSSVAGLGGIVGGAMVGAVSRRLPAARMLPWSLIAAAVVLGALVVAARPLWLVMLGYTLLQLPLAGFGASLATVMQQRVPEAARGRVFGALASAQSTALILGIFLMGAVAPRVGIVGALAGSAGLLALASGAARLATGRSSTNVSAPYSRVPGD